MRWVLGMMGVAGLGGCPSLCLAQQRVEVLNAERLTVVKEDGETRQRLEGAVVLKQDSALLFCDVATLFEQENRVEAEGNVRAQLPDTIEVFAQRLEYLGDTKVLELFGNVLLKQPRRELRTQRLTYYRLEKYGFYPNQGELRDTANVLTSRLGYYFTDARDALFRDSVRLVGRKYVLTADSLRYNTHTETAFAESLTRVLTDKNEQLLTERGWVNTRTRESFLYQNPSYRDSSYFLRADTLYYSDSLRTGWAHCRILAENRDTTLFLGGERARFDRNTHETWVFDHPWAVGVDDGDTLTLLADTLHSRDDSLAHQQWVRAWPNLRCTGPDVQAVADSLVYDRRDSVLSAYGDPVLWTGPHQLTGDTLRLWIRNGSPDSLAIYRSAFIISRESPRFFNQVRGRDVHGKFADDKLVYLRVQGNAESLYYSKDEAQNTFTGLNKATSQNLEVFLADNKPQRIRFLQSPKGSYQPVKPAEAPPRLEGFRDRSSQKPKYWLGDTALQRLSIAGGIEDPRARAAGDSLPTRHDSLMHLPTDSASGNVDTAAARLPMPRNTYTADSLRPEVPFRRLPDSLQRVDPKPKLTQQQKSEQRSLARQKKREARLRRRFEALVRRREKKHRQNLPLLQ